MGAVEYGEVIYGARRPGGAWEWKSIAGGMDAGVENALGVDAFGGVHAVFNETLFDLIYAYACPAR